MYFCFGFSVFKVVKLDVYFVFCFIILEKDKVYNRMIKNKVIDKIVVCFLKIEREKRSEECIFVEREMKR